MITSKRKTKTTSRTRRASLNANSMKKITFAGSQESNKKYLNGNFHIGQLGFWNRALTGEEVLQLYKGTPVIRNLRDSQCCQEKTGIVSRFHIQEEIFAKFNFRVSTFTLNDCISICHWKFLKRYFSAQRICNTFHCNCKIRFCKTFFS